MSSQNTIPNHKVQAIVKFDHESDQSQAYIEMMSYVRANFPGEWAEEGKRRSYHPRWKAAGMHTRHGDAFVDFVSEADAIQFREGYLQTIGIEQIILLDGSGYPLGQRPLSYFDYSC